MEDPAELRRQVAQLREENRTLRGELKAAVGDPYRRINDGRKHDFLGRLVPRNMMADAGLLARVIPGLAARFDREVPATHLEEWGVRCVCGTLIEHVRSRMVTCPGGCGRHFLRTGENTVRVARDPEPSQ